MKPGLLLPLLALGLGFAAPSTSLAREEPTASVSLCALTNDRAAYDGRSVEVSATVRAIYQDNYYWLEDPACPKDTVFFRFVDGSVPRVDEFEWNMLRSWMCSRSKTLRVVVRGVVMAPAGKAAPRLTIYQIVEMDHWKSQAEIPKGALCESD